MSMKLIGNRNNPNCVYQMQWSNKMDLIALVNDTGEVTINRFKFDIYSVKIPPPEEKASVTSIAWRMDEKIIAIAYSNQIINLVDIESKENISSLNVKSDIKSICWTQNAIEIDEAERSILEDHKVYLAPLPNINNTITSANKKIDYRSTKFYSKNMLNFLLVICNDGKVKIFIYGVLSCGTIDIRKSLEASENDKIDILEAKLSSDFKQLFVIYTKNDRVSFLTFENPILFKNHISLWKLSVKYGMILNTLDYVDDTIEQINEAWESVLLEMDNKLSKYAKRQQSGGVSADFLELLMFGYPSEQLEQFLTQDMTVRELKKLSNSVELSYSTIQKLVVKPLHSAIVGMFYHVNQVYGMHQNAYYYRELLGETCNQALSNTGSFLIKSHELQHVIDKSMRDYKIFFRWLYIAISRLMDDSVPDDAGVITQQEINYLAEFLFNFEENRKESVHEESGEKEIKFNLERVGQYLSNKDLLIQSQDENIWTELLAQNECFSSNKFIFPCRKNTSLIQEKNNMHKSINDLFGRLETSVGSGFKLISSHLLNKNFQINTDFKFITSQIMDNDGSQTINLFSILLSEKDLLFIAYFPNNQIKIAKLQFSNRDECIISSVGHLTFIDAKFYNTKLLSVLMKNENGSKSQSCFLQLPVSRLLDELMENSESEIANMNVYAYIDESSFKVIEGFNGTLMAVSGSRKVAAFLACNQKIVKLYELEVDEDDTEEENNSTNASFEMDLKM